jgi:serine/threonine-protein kinase
VFLARQRGFMNFRKLVVVKRIHPHLAKQQEFINMLLDEARISALLKHPRVVDIYDLGRDDDTYFIAMEYLSGQSLTEIIKAGRKRRKLDIYSAARVLADAAEGLDAAHNLKTFVGEPLELVHRDVSPGNIIVQYNGDVKIVHFGVSKAKGRLSQTGVRKVKGKLGYASPEQVSGRPLDRRADIFALGVVMWELLAHRRLFMADSSAATLKMILDGNPRPPSDYRKETPRELDEICLRALAVDPADRYQNASDMQEELQDFLRAANYYRESKIISKYMDDMFSHRRREQEELIRRVAEATQELDLEEEDDDDGFDEESSKDTEVGPVPPSTTNSSSTRQMDAKTIAEMAESSKDDNRPLPSVLKTKSLLREPLSDEDRDFITAVESVDDLKKRAADRHETFVEEGDKTEPNAPAISKEKLRKLSALPPPNKVKKKKRPVPIKTAAQRLQAREAAAKAKLAKQADATDEDFGPKSTIKSVNPPVATDADSDDFGPKKTIKSVNPPMVKSSGGEIAAAVSGETESKAPPEGLDPTEIVEPLKAEDEEPATYSRKWLALGGGGLMLLAVILFSVIGGGGKEVATAGPTGGTDDPTTKPSNVVPSDPVDDPDDDAPFDPDDDPDDDPVDPEDDPVEDDPIEDDPPADEPPVVDPADEPTMDIEPDIIDPPPVKDVPKKDVPKKDVPKKDVPKKDVPKKDKPTRAEIRAKKKADREAAKALNQEAVSMFVKGQLGPARSKFLKATRLSPGFALPHRGLGLVYERQGNKSKAVRSLKRYLKLSPKARDAASIGKRIKRLGG